MSTNENLASSVQAQLLNIAKAEGRDYGQVLTKFALERLLTARLVKWDGSPQAVWH